jgi:phospholipid transport system transporter-binding protein
MTDDRKPAAGAGGSFAAAASGERWVYDGALTFAEAGSALAAAQALPLPTAGAVDCSGIGAIDSAAVAVLLALKRRAAAESRRLEFRGVPAALATLADLYGVGEMLAA